MLQGLVFLRHPLPPLPPSRTNTYQSPHPLSDLRRYFLPESESEVEVFLRAAHDSGQKLRVVRLGEGGRHRG